MHVACDRGSVILWRRCDTLCTSAFVDDVTSSHNGLMASRIPKRRKNTLEADITDSFNGKRKMSRKVSKHLSN